jgi:tetratricopeptide (TPR) repeat protein
MFIIGALVLCIMCCLATTSGYFIWKYSDPTSALSTAMDAGSPTKPSGGPSMDDPRSEPLKATLTAYGFQMDEAYRKGDLQAWSDTASKAMKIEPNNPVTYYSLAVTFLGESDGEPDFSNRMNLLTHAFRQIDGSIGLNPNYGNSYLIRAVCLTQLAGAYPYRADREYLYKLALPDLDKAIELGTSTGFQPARLKVEYLTLLNQCGDAIKLIPSLPRIPNDSKSVNSNKTNEELATQAYACLGQYQQAIDSANKNLQTKNNESRDENLELAIALYQSGKSSEALELVKKVLSEKSSGKHFFLKAAIEYDQKDFINALTDGEKADQYSWGAGEYSSYFEGLEAARLGNAEEAILKMQFAEAALEPQFDFAIKRARAELSALNAKPIEVTPAIHFSKNTEKK